LNQDPNPAIEEVDENNNNISDEMTIESSSETINRNRRRGVGLGDMLNFFIRKKLNPHSMKTLKKRYMGTCVSLSWI